MPRRGNSRPAGAIHDGVSRQFTRGSAIHDGASRQFILLDVSEQSSFVSPLAPLTANAWDVRGDAAKQGTAPAGGKDTVAFSRKSSAKSNAGAYFRTDASFSVPIQRAKQN
jgi:hypothetical protein